MFQMINSESKSRSVRFISFRFVSETKRNENKTKRNEMKRKRNETKQNENEMKRNETLFLIP